jgi:hypothetical protein
MAELDLDQPVSVTAEERVHPAIQKLARACITLALLAKEAAPSPSDASADGERADD